MAEVVYALCAITSFACAFLLVRGWQRSGVRLLLWTAIGFVGLALNNIGLFLDLVVFPSVPLTMLRTIPAVLGMLIFVCAMAWEDV